MKTISPDEFKVKEEETFFKNEFKLPPLPSVVLQIQEMIYSENTSIDEISELVSIDPVLVAQILKLVNSAYYGLHTEVLNITPAG